MKKNSEFGSLRQPDLRRGQLREERQRHAIALPAQGLGERPQELTERRHRSGRTSVTYIDADASCRITMSALARRDSAMRACGLAIAAMQQAGGDERSQPERQIAGEVVALADRQHARRGQAPHVGPPADHAPAPQDEQRRRDRQQPQQRPAPRTGTSRA